MDLNLETLKGEILDYLAASEFGVFRGHPGGLESLPIVSWDSESFPDYRMFLEAARKTGQKLIIFASREFEEEEILEALDELETTETDHRKPTSVNTKAACAPPKQAYVEVGLHRRAGVWSYNARTRTSTKRAPTGTTTSSKPATKSPRCSPVPTRMTPTTATTASADSTPTTSRWEFRWRRGCSGRCRAAPRSSTFRGPHGADPLESRTTASPLAAARFLDPRLADLHDPFLLKDMDRAVERIREAIVRSEKIEIHGDYDVDGVTSTVVLKKTLEMAGATSVHWHIPHRLLDGYGLQPAAIDEAFAARGVRLIVSVDNGIRATPAVRRAREHGIDVIVTDHHLPEAELPPALAVINPSRADCSYPNKNLCGAGVVFKLAHAILARAGWTEARLYRVLESLLKLVAIATVADIVPLTGENRIIVRHGLQRARRYARNPGLRALLAATGFAGKSPDGHRGRDFASPPPSMLRGVWRAQSQAVRMFLTADPRRSRGHRLRSW